MSTVVLGVGGGIAAYKACYLVRRLAEAGHRVHVIPTEAALQFVGRPTWEALSGNPVHTTVFDDVPGVEHVRLGEQADLVIVAPATADLVSRIAAGAADDLLTATILATRAPVLVAPAMHTAMWQNPATRDNVATLRRRGVVVKDPADGRLTGPDSGPGRLPEPDELAELAALLLADPGVVGSLADQDLTGRQVVISAGGTREALDPVRYLGNSSSGRMGTALAMLAAARGAEVTLVSAHLEVPVPSCLHQIPVSSTEDLSEVMGTLAPSADVIVMAVAAADFAPVSSAQVKIKKHEGSDAVGAGTRIDLVQTPDVLAALAASRRPGQVIVGFAAETAPDRAELLELAAAKLRRKGCDLLVVNDVSAGKVFGKVDTDVTVVRQQGPGRRVQGPKMMAAQAILDEVRSLLAPASGTPEPVPAS
ncbi:bifunctional phosphopantothenoylcysteine decarboxylase/phosphopantothenate--cysteine ligase CoaBC [Acidipropionibacterium jensenii]|uniref:Coenzyme A biosynthesis bifunctional protein CoaBC n=1 Tax=Acidipropionibacterium jensenii TaxID=1749 RepID=A0A3T0RZE4_9ACTN|nr:bifunctional phosphopantothenoylcysteine decarboxylase/phosphopantothenate--cysteine ligase CoaBC [Acidipropionibacterium jensenii]AZZ39462.1 bifunctional phosphopantothenoylcysteine decarboxylase/phosphopantothenate--cysteine ligase CoaBC [Acidipropionibacterium jensenii]